MKALSFQIPKPEYESYRIQIDEVPYFYDLFHYHPEFQITLIEQGHGTCIIGDYISTFMPGDLFVIGQNLPHVFKSDKSYYTNNKEGCLSTSIFLSPSFISNSFFDLNEVKELQHLFVNSKRGLRYRAENKSILKSKFKKINSNNTLEGVIHVLELLHELNSNEDLEHLSHIDYKSISKESDGFVLNKVFHFTLNNFQEEIPLDKVSDMANMSPAAFCRFFKKRTRKTYISFLNEVRIQEACRLLLKPDLTISEICFDAGFKNISNFNRQFKKITGFTPKTYRKQQQTH